jgi:putative endonuclease
MYFCYVLECAGHSLYVGVTDNPARRMQERNEGQGAQWTAQRRPGRIVWVEEPMTLASARPRENQLKGWSRAKKAALILDRRVLPVAC